ncbi:MAG TPA: hypothetical protein VEQ42_14070 [Pyrinomonadaceae bacterium]|nr:hypothetical protein [Pyrinomonadaceae bacterium]
MNSSKCARCGLVQFNDAGDCRRCGATLDAATPHYTPAPSCDTALRAADAWAVVSSESQGGRAARGRSLFRRALAVCVATALLLVVFYVSLLESAEPLGFEQRRSVERAVARIEQAGFGRDAFFLRRLASFRATDNWWNRTFGHQDAYAATNFPFEIVTLYPDFFDITTDDTERAAVLLHEARHLGGAGEEEAFESVWRDKDKLGWTRAAYGSTPVFLNVQEFTLRHAPRLFACGPERRADCTE